MKVSSLLKSAVCVSAAALLTSAVAEDHTTPSSPVPNQKARPTNNTERVSERQTKRSTDALTTEQKEVDATVAPDADNTRRNKRDRDNATLTPGDQGNTKEDIEVTRQIRRALMKDKALSMTAKNVKIITKDGAVTVRGPVKTEVEKQAIVAKAKEVATSVHPVTDELEVKAQTEFESKDRSSEREVKEKQ